MKKCKKCGKEWPDTAQFCGVCGATLEETKGGRKPASTNVIKIIVAVLIAAAALVGIKFGVSSGKNSGAAVDSRLAAEMDFEVETEEEKKPICVALADKQYNLFQNIESDQVFNIGENVENSFDPSLVKFDPDGRFVYYIGNLNGSDVLYQCEYQKIKEEADSGKYTKAIASGINSIFYPFNDGKVIYEDDGWNLYYYDGEKSQKIADNVSSYYCNEDDQDRVVYEKTSNGNEKCLYGVQLKNLDQKKLLAQYYEGIYSISDFDHIVYYQHDDHNKHARIEVYATGFSTSPEKIGLVVENHYLTSESKVCYVTLDEDRDLETLYIDNNGEQLLIAEKVISEAYYYYRDVLLYRTEDDRIFMYDTTSGTQIEVTEDARETLEKVFDKSDEPIFAMNDTEILVSYNRKVMAADIHNGNADSFQTLTKSGFVINGSRSQLYYISDLNTDYMYAFGALYRYHEGEAQCMAKEVLPKMIDLYEDGTIVAFTDYAMDYGYELSIIYPNGTRKKIGEGVLYYIRCNEESILYQSDSDLWLFKNGEKRELLSGLNWFWCPNSMKIEQRLGVDYLDSVLDEDYEEDYETHEETEAEQDLQNETSQDEKIRYIKSVYYGIQDKLNQYTVKKIQKNMEVYYDDNAVKRIVCWNSACSNSDYTLPEGYSAEYYYDADKLVFVFIYDGTIEYRFYIDPNDETKCIRYIGPDGVVQDFVNGVDPVDKFGDMGKFCYAGYMELKWQGAQTNETSETGNLEKYFYNGGEYEQDVQELQDLEYAYKDINNDGKKELIIRGLIPNGDQYSSNYRYLFYGAEKQLSLIGSFDNWQNGGSGEMYYDSENHAIVVYTRLSDSRTYKLYQVTGKVQEMKEIRRQSLDVQNSNGSAERAYQYQVEDLISMETKDWTETEWEDFENNLEEIIFQSFV